VVVGCAKSRLVGTFRPPALEAGQWSPLIHKDQTIGAALRTCKNVSPIFISSGNRIDLENALKFTMAVTDGYRVPKPTRWADRLVGRLKRGESIADFGMANDPSLRGGRHTSGDRRGDLFVAQHATHPGETASAPHTYGGPRNDSSENPKSTLRNLVSS